MELKKITYSGIDTDDVTKQMEEGNDKLAEKGWREYRVDMLSSSTVRVTYARGEEDEEGLVDMRTLFRAAVKNHASDMLLSSGTAPVLRLNGELRAMALPPLRPEDIERLLFSVISRRQRVALEEKRELDFALSATLQLDAGGTPPVSRLQCRASRRP